MNPSEWSLDREIVIARVFDAPRALVFDAWTKPEHVQRWFGPKGFTLTTQEIDIRVGGRWRFTFRGPDGTTWGQPHGVSAGEGAGAAGVRPRRRP